MVAIGSKIKKVRKFRDISQVELERRTGIKREYLSKIESGDLPNPTYKTLSKISQGLGISLIELISDDKDPCRHEPVVLEVVTPSEGKERTEKLVREGAFYPVPVISSKFAAQGQTYIPPEEIEDYLVLPAGLLPKAGEANVYRCVRVLEGDESMSPLIVPGSLVVVDITPVEAKSLSGKIVLLRDGDKSILRRLRVERNVVIALPENLQGYNPLVLPQGRRDVILGTVSWVLRGF